MTTKQAFDQLAEKMDDRERAIKLALEFKNVNGYVPDQFKNMERFFDEKPWRQDWIVVRKIKIAARKMAKNSASS